MGYTSFPTNLIDTAIHDMSSRFSRINQGAQLMNYQHTGHQEAGSSCSASASPERSLSGPRRFRWIQKSVISFLLSALVRQHFYFSPRSLFADRNTQSSTGAVSKLKIPRWLFPITKWPLVSITCACVGANSLKIIRSQCSSVSKRIFLPWSAEKFFFFFFLQQYCVYIQVLYLFSACRRRKLHSKNIQDSIIILFFFFLTWRCPGQLIQNIINF